MLATPLERTAKAGRLPRLAIDRGHVEHCPVQLDGIFLREHLVCHGMQCLVIANVRHLGRNREVSPQQPGHAGIHQRVRLTVDEKQGGVGHVLSNGGKFFQFLPSPRPLPGKCGQSLRQAMQRRRPTPPEPDGTQGLGERVDVARGDLVPTGESVEESRQERGNRFRPGPLQQHLDHQFEVIACTVLAPRESTPISREPREQFRSKRLGALVGCRTTWRHCHVCVRIARRRAPMRLLPS